MKSMIENQLVLIIHFSAYNHKIYVKDGAVWKDLFRLIN